MWMQVIWGEKREKDSTIIASNNCKFRFGRERNPEWRQDKVVAGKRISSLRENKIWAEKPEV
jgi:hypothetical protein